MSVKINDNIRLEIAGENALILYFFDNEQSELVADANAAQDQKKNDVTSAKINNQVQQAAQLIRHHLATDIVDLIPSYASILVVFNLLDIDHHHLRNKLKKLLQRPLDLSNNQGKLIELPVYYSLESGIDLKRIAKRAQLTVEQVITLHQAQEYRVYAIGFAPGFAYLGEVHESIATPRLTTPRLKVPKGAVAIADRQTAIYPTESPGGWNIVGLCPIEMFNPQAVPVMPVAVGDRVKFVSIDKSQFLALGGTTAQINGLLA